VTEEPETPKAEFSVDIDVLKAQVGVFVDEDHFNRWFESKGMESKKDLVNGVARYVIDPEGRAWFVMYLPPDAGAGLIAHECNHTAFHMIEHHGIRSPTPDANEFHSYLLDALVRGVVTGLQRAQESDAGSNSRQLDGQGDS